MWTDTTRAHHARKGLSLPSNLTDAEWAILEPHFPPASHVGRPHKWPMRRKRCFCPTLRHVRLCQKMVVMEADTLTSALDTSTGVAREPIARAEVLRGMAGRRRVWTLEQKLAIVAEMGRCDNIAAFSRQHDIPTSLLYTWRREFRYAAEARQGPDADKDRAPMFVPVFDDSPKPKSHDIAIEVELDGALVRIDRTANPALVRAVIKALQVPR